MAATARLVAVAVALAAIAAGGCGGDEGEEDRAADLEEIERLSERLVRAGPGQLCALLTPEYMAVLEDQGDGSCEAAAEVTNLAATRRSSPGFAADRRLEEAEAGTIADGGVSFEEGAAELVLCVTPSCVSDLGAWVVGLRETDGRWRVEALEYRVESF